MCVGFILFYMDDQIIFDVRDDGVGGAALCDGGFGLTLMLECVQLLHGELVIESELGLGIVVLVSVLV